MYPIKIFSPSNLIRLRISKNIIQQEIADFLDIHQTTVYHWESGKKGYLPNANQIQYLAYI